MFKKKSLHKQLARKEIYKSNWMNLFLDDVELSSGRVISDYHVIDFERDGVATVVTDIDNKILMVKSDRYTINKFQWELPAGDGDIGEDILQTAEREVIEETGYKIKNMELLYTFHPLVGISNKKFHVVLASVAEKVGEPDPHEIAEIRWFSQVEIDLAIRNKELTDGFSLGGILLSRFFRV